jgi:undecaprenyl-diphosphatase
MPINQSLFVYIHNFSGRSPIFDGIGIFFANYLVYFLVFGFFFLVLVESGPRRKLYRFAEGALATLLSRGIVTELIRFFYHHPRPFLFYGFTPLISESSWSFPSGHMTFLFALATVVWYADRRWGIAYFILSAVVGVARIYVGVHWPLDILGGVVIGIVCGIIIHRLFRSSRTALYETEELGARS